MLKNTFNFKGQQITFYVHPEHKKNKPKALLDLISSQIFNRDKFYEQEDLEASMKYLGEGDVVLDCGANIGNHSVFWAKICGCKVIAFEPFDKNYDLLVKNNEVNDCGIDVRKTLLSDKSRRFSCVSSDRNQGATVYEENENGEFSSKALDDVVDSSLMVKVMKVDVEGEELNVLKGSIGIIERCHPILFVEIHPYVLDLKNGRRMLPENKSEVISFLNDLGYVEEYEIDNRYVFKYMGK